ncbi:uncharacterized protein LOC121864791 [Homarus americanus]|uniref:uncharacterized protein LOC121864791 n=1 Tax=Homarus americanus TaxID=6706 RepID=UPI001C438525|nr:uncharacterized protein LOC121864791 [Homarus americanus]
MMEKVEKKLTRFRATLKNKRKLSLPVFINQFQQQWAEQHGGGSTSGGLEVGGGVTSSSGSSFGSLTSIPHGVEKEGRRGMSPTNLNLPFLPLDLSAKERLSSNSGGSSSSPYSTMSHNGRGQHHHTNLITSVSSPGGTTLLVPGTPPYPIVRLSLPDGTSSRTEVKADSKTPDNEVSVSTVN